MNSGAYNRLQAMRFENEAAALAQEEIRPRFERMKNRHENGSAPRAVSAYQLFQTPPQIALEMARLTPGGRFLEPSAGLGRLLDAMAEVHPDCRGVAVEMASQCAGELFRQDRWGIAIRQRDFLACSPSEFGAFDSIIMNPPFHMRQDVKHILHARQFLAPGGVLVALCLDTVQRAAILRPMASRWIPLGENQFAKEGTRVPVILLTIKPA